MQSCHVTRKLTNQSLRAPLRISKGDLMTFFLSATYKFLSRALDGTSRFLEKLHTALSQRLCRVKYAVNRNVCQ